MEIRKNMMVTLNYILRLDGFEGEIIEQTTSDKPLRFVFGAGVMLPKFEALLEGKKQGEKFEISLGCKDAYGEEDENAIVDLPKNIFIVDGKFDEEIIKVGNSVPMMNSNGQQMNGIVMEIKDDAVKMDFNHPLASEDLFFTGDIVEVREATDEEIAALFAGGCNGCEGGTCSDDGCSENGSCSCGS